MGQVEEDRSVVVAVEVDQKCLVAGEVLWRRKRPLWRRREERALSHILRGLWALPRCLLKACLLGAECLGPRLHGLLCYLCHLCEKARSGTCLLGLHLGSRHCSRLWLDSSGG